MTRSRKPRAESVTVAIRSMVNAAAPLPACPAQIKMRAQDVPFWEGILRARARDEWTESDLVIGAQLARCQADIEAHSLLLDTESEVVKRRGSPVLNPRVLLLDRLNKREIALLRALRMGGPIPIRNLNERRGVELAAKRARAEIAGEDRESILN